MPPLDRYDYLFTATSFFIQIVLLIYFAVRKWNFDATMRFGMFRRTFDPRLAARMQ